MNNRFNDLSGQTFGSLTVITTSSDQIITGKGRGTYSYCYCSKYNCYGWVSNVSLLNGQTISGIRFEYKPLPKNLIVDEELIGILRNYTWHNRAGYYSGQINKERISVHQYVWFLKTGEKVKGTNITLDHINRNRADNRFCNLRKATPQQNALNQTKQKTFNGRPVTSKYIGVSFDRVRNKWRANLKVNGKLITLGRFLTEEQAYQARIDYIKLHCTEEDLKFRNI